MKDKQIKKLIEAEKKRQKSVINPAEGFGIAILSLGYQGFQILRRQRIFYHGDSSIAITKLTINNNM